MSSGVKDYTARQESSGEHQAVPAAIAVLGEAAQETQSQLRKQLRKHRTSSGSSPEP